MSSRKIKKQHHNRSDVERKEKKESGCGERGIPGNKAKVIAKDSVKRDSSNGNCSNTKSTYRGIVSSIRDTVAGTASILQQGLVAVFPPLPHIPEEYRERIEAKNRIEEREMSEARRRIDASIKEDESNRKLLRKKIDKAIISDLHNNKGDIIDIPDRLEYNTESMKDCNPQILNDSKKIRIDNFIIPEQQLCGKDESNELNFKVKPDTSIKNMGEMNSTILSKNDINKEHAKKYIICLNEDNVTQMDIQQCHNDNKIPQLFNKLNAPTYNNEYKQNMNFHEELNNSKKRPPSTDLKYEENPKSIKLSNYLHNQKNIDTNLLTITDLMKKQNDMTHEDNRIELGTHNSITRDDFMIKNKIFISDHNSTSSNVYNTPRLSSSLMKLYDTKSYICRNDYPEYNNRIVNNQKRLNNQKLHSSVLFNKCNRESLPLENSFNSIFGGKNSKISNIIKNTDCKFKNKFPIFQSPSIDISNATLSYENKQNKSLAHFDISRKIDAVNLKSTVIFSKCNNEYIPLENSFTKIFCFNEKNTNIEDKKINITENQIKDNKLPVPLIPLKLESTIQFKSSKTITECLKFNISKRTNDNIEEHIPTKMKRISSGDAITSLCNVNIENTDIDSDYITVNSSEESIYRTKDRLMDIYLDEQYALTMEGRSSDNPITIKTEDSISSCIDECHCKDSKSDNKSINVDNKKYDLSSTELNDDDSKIYMHNEQDCSDVMYISNSDSHPSIIVDSENKTTKNAKHINTKNNKLSYMQQKNEIRYDQSTYKEHAKTGTFINEDKQKIKTNNNHLPQQVSIPEQSIPDIDLNENNSVKEIIFEEEYLSPTKDCITLHDLGCNNSVVANSTSTKNEIHESFTGDNDSFSDDTLVSESTTISGLPSRHFTAEQILEFQRSQNNGINIEKDNNEFSEIDEAPINSKFSNSIISPLLITTNADTTERKFQKVIPYEEFEKISKLPTGQCPNILATPHTLNQPGYKQSSPTDRTNNQSDISNIISAVAKPKENIIANSSPKIATSKLFKKISTKECGISPSKDKVLGNMTPFKPFTSSLIPQIANKNTDEDLFKRPLDVNHPQKNCHHTDNSIHIPNRKISYIPLAKPSIVSENLLPKIAHTNTPLYIPKHDSVLQGSETLDKNIITSSKLVLPPPRKSSVLITKGLKKIKESEINVFSREKIDDNESSSKSRTILDLTVNTNEESNNVKK